MIECVERKRKVVNNLLANWEDFLRDLKDEKMRSVTLEAWNRCANLNLSFDNINVEILENGELDLLREENKRLIEITDKNIDFLKYTLENTPYIIALSDKDGWIIAIYGDWQKFGGRDNALAPGASWAEKNIGNNGIGTTLKRGKATFVYGYEHYVQDYSSLACFGVPIKNSNGDIIGALDLSVPLEYAQPGKMILAQMAANSIENSLKTEKMEKDVSEFNLENILEGLYISLLHEFRTPLTSIFSALSLMENKDIDPYFNILEKNSFRLLKLVDNLILIFQMDSNVQELKKFNFDISEFIEILIERINSYIYDLDIKIIKKNFQKGIILKCNKTYFQKLIINLLSNAVKASKKGDEIYVSVVKKNKRVVVSVVDSGGGIPVSEQDKIFTKFYRMDNFFVRNSEGMGLGLYIVKKIANLHDAEIEINSREGEGSTFNIFFPVVENNVDGMVEKVESNINQVKVEFSDIYLT